MASVIINDEHLTAIGDAIREKNGLTDTYKPGEMAAAIAELPVGGSNTLPDVWYSCKPSQYNAIYNYYQIDTSKASKLTFSYDYNFNDTTTKYLSIDVHCGLKLVYSSTTSVSVETIEGEGSTTYNAADRITAAVKNVRVDFSVYDYSNVVITVVVSSGGNAHCSVFLHDIVLE